MNPIDLKICFAGDERKAIGCYWRACSWRGCFDGEILILDWIPHARYK